jgi:hypothetical protein
MKPTPQSQATIYFILAGVALLVALIAIVKPEPLTAMVMAIVALYLGLRGFKLLPEPLPPPPEPYLPPPPPNPPGTNAFIHQFSFHARLSYPPEYLLLTVALLIPESEADEPRLKQAELFIKTATVRTAAQYDQLKLRPETDGVFPRIEQSILHALPPKGLFTSFTVTIVAYDVSSSLPDQKKYPGIVIGI